MRKPNPSQLFSFRMAIFFLLCDNCKLCNTFLRHGRYRRDSWDPFLHHGRYHSDS